MPRDDIPFDNVVPFLRERPEPGAPVRKTTTPAPWCDHRQTEVDEGARQVTCAKCHAVLDPIAVLAMCARSPDRFKWYADEERRLRAEVDRLEGEVKKLRTARGAIVRRRKSTGA